MEEKKITTNSRYTLEDKLMSAAARGVSRNMPHEVYMDNHNKILEETGLGGLKIQYKPIEEEKKNRR